MNSYYFQNIADNIRLLEEVKSVCVLINQVGRFDRVKQMPPYSIRVIIDADAHLQKKKVAKIIENWRPYGVATVGNTSVRIKFGPKGYKLMKNVQFELVKV